jgi:hypothetical protein
MRAGNCLRWPRSCRVKPRRTWCRWREVYFGLGKPFKALSIAHCAATIAAFIEPAEALGGAAPTAPEMQTIPDLVEKTTAPAAIERALAIYQQLQPRDQSVILQPRKILTQHIYGMVDRGERDEQRLTVGGLAPLKALEREHGSIKSAHGAEASSPA